MSPSVFPFALVAALGAFLAGASPALAYKFTPMSQVFAPSGSGTTQSFEVVNDGSERLALELSITTLARDLDYVETNVSADENFLLYPAQILLPPGGRQKVRVTWVGEPNPKRELTYRLVAEELPINNASNEAESGVVRILTTFRATLYIRPAKAAPKVSLASAERIESKAPGHTDSLAIIVQNTGTAQGALKDCKTTARSGETTVALPADSLGVLQQGRILADHKRRFLVPWPAGLPLGPVTVNLQCRAEL